MLGVSVCLPSDAVLQHLPSYLSFSYLGLGVSLYGCYSKVQLLLLTLDKGYLLTAALPDLQRGIAPLGPPAPAQPPFLGYGLIFPASAPGLGRGVAPPGRRPWHWVWGGSSRLFLHHCSLALSAAAPVLRHGVTPLGRHPSGMGSSRLLPGPRMWGNSFRPCLVHRSQLPTHSSNLQKVL